MNADIIAETLHLTEEAQLSQSVVKENFEIMATEINRLDNLVKDVLRFSRQMELDYAMVNLKDLIDIVHVQFRKKMLDKNIEFVNNSENISLCADIDKIKQLFINLIDNAIEAVNKSGMIEISSRKIDEDKVVSIYVKDNGNGIEPSLKIFEPFFTTKSSGTGLGLAISQKIIEQHKGTFRLVSSIKGETIFEINLPINGKNYNG
jgi:signal transduction histidine kinase